MRPAALTSKIFLDSADPDETKEALGLLGFLDGQTTNPTLLSKNPERMRREVVTRDMLLAFYRETIQKISSIIPGGAVSIEVYADDKTPASAMLDQAGQMYAWIPNAYIKFPTTAEGLTAARQAVSEGTRVNMTLVFSQEQAAAVYGATQGAQKGQVLVSPFVGRLDDQGENGMDLVKNVIAMYRGGDGHVAVLAASVRSVDQLLYAIQLGSDCVTVPVKVLRAWAQKSLPLPEADFAYDAGTLKPIPYRGIDITQDWQKLNLTHNLTAIGVEKFSDDWNALIQPTGTSKA